MANTKTKNTYDVTRDRPLAPALVVHIDQATGEKVGGPGEGVQSFGIVLRQMTNEDGTSSPPRIALCTAFKAKEAKSTKGERYPRWMVGAGGKCELGQPTPGAICLGAAAGRFDPLVGAVVYEEAAKYSKLVASKLAAKAKAA